MLTKPDIREGDIAACLDSQYGLRAVQVTFLPLGADVNTAVYRVAAQDGTPYFVKLRQGDLDRVAVTLPRFLSDQGIRQIIPPLPTQAGQLWGNLDAYRVIVYPFVEGRDGYQVPMSKGQWRELGAALLAIHTAELPAALEECIPRETYSSRWQKGVRSFLERVGHDAFADPVAAELASFLQAKREELLRLVGRAGELGAELRARSPEAVLCHSDLHAGNVLLTARGQLYLVDWDNPTLAPKERDSVDPVLWA
jgi:spectinomycin phosphotransferase